MDIFSKKNYLVLLAAALVIIIGFWAIYLTPRFKPEAVTTQADAEIQQIQEQSKSDDIDSIEEDLNATELDNIDKELQDIENEL